MFKKCSLVSFCIFLKVLKKVTCIAISFVSFNDTIFFFLFFLSLCWQGVDIHITHKVCREIVHLVEKWFLHGAISDLIINFLKSKVPDMVNKLIGDSANAALSALVLSKNIDKYANVNFYLTQNPSSANDELTIYLSGQVTKK